jgi:hypothetical protein
MILALIPTVRAMLISGVKWTVELAVLGHQIDRQDSAPPRLSAGISKLLFHVLLIEYGIQY